MKILIIIWELDQKGKEKKTASESFDNRIDAEKYISAYKAEMKPYKMQKGKLNYTMN